MTKFTVPAGKVEDLGGGVVRITIDAAGSPRPYLDRYSNPLDGTMGDDFTEASLNGRWARRTITSGMESYQQGDGTWLVADIASATQQCQYLQTCPSGDWEFIVKMRVSWTRGSGTPVFMYGMACLDSSGNGKGIVFYTDQLVYHATIASYVYSSYNRVMGYSYSAMSGHSIWFRVRKSGTTIYASHSEDGDVWSEEFGVTDSATWAEITIGRFLGTASGEQRFAVDRFDRVA